MKFKCVNGRQKPFILIAVFDYRLEAISNNIALKKPENQSK